MASGHNPKVVPLFKAPPPPPRPDSMVSVLRAMADAAAALGRAAECIDAGPVDADTKLLLVRGIHDLVGRSFDLNTAYMKAVGLVPGTQRDKD